MSKIKSPLDYYRQLIDDHQVVSCGDYSYMPIDQLRILKPSSRAKLVPDREELIKPKTFGNPPKDYNAEPFRTFEVDGLEVLCVERAFLQHNIDNATLETKTYFDDITARKLASISGLTCPVR